MSGEDQTANLPEWHQDWLDTQGFIYNDDDLISDLREDEPEAEYCPECNGAGDRVQDFWGEGKGRLLTCKRCNGRGYIWV
jgi:hypothetical protein